MRSRPFTMCFLLLCGCVGGSDVPSADSADAPSASMAPKGPVVAIQVGGDADMDACSLGSIRSGASGPGGWVPVRSGPGERFATIDSIDVAQRFSSCDSDGQWVGIIYRKEGDSPDEKGDCGGMNSPVPDKRAYNGPCRSGWIPDAVHEIVAG